MLCILARRLLGQAFVMELVLQANRPPEASDGSSHGITLYVVPSVFSKARKAASLQCVTQAVLSHEN